MTLPKTPVVQNLLRSSSLQVVSSTFQIQVHSHFDLVSSLLAVEATEPVFEPETQMALELINILIISAQ